MAIKTPKICKKEIQIYKNTNIQKIQKYSKQKCNDIIWEFGFIIKMQTLSVYFEHTLYKISL